MSASFFDSMIVSNGRNKCRASDLYTKKDPFIKHPQSFHDLTDDEKRNTKAQINDPNRRTKP